MTNRIALPSVNQMSLSSSYKGELSEQDALLILQYLDGPGIQNSSDEVSAGTCPICSQMIEKGKAYDDAFLWEKSLSHAILHHGATPPDDFIQHVRKVMNLKKLFHVLEEG